MHMRTKKWARPELSVCPYFTNDAPSLRGKWRTLFEKDQPLHLELGCGKGLSTAQMVHDNPDINYIVVDITSDVLGDTRRNIERAFAGEPVKNVIIARFDIEYIRNVFAPEDHIDRIYINFCNPWTKHSKHSKRRLTHPRQLLQYREFLNPGAQVYFKTDNMYLFIDSLCYFRDCGFACSYLVSDLHASGFTPNYVSEHEQKFSAMGVPIKFGIFTMLEGTPEVKAVRYALPEGFYRNLPEYPDYGAESGEEE